MATMRGDRGDTEMQDCSCSEEGSVCTTSPLCDTLHITGAFASVDSRHGHRYRTDYRAAYDAGAWDDVYALQRNAEKAAEEFFREFKDAISVPGLEVSSGRMLHLKELVYGFDYYIDQPFVVADCRKMQRTSPPYVARSEPAALPEVSPARSEPAASPEVSPARSEPAAFVPQSALFSAAMSEAYAVVDILVGANVDKRGYGTLHRAPARPVCGVCEGAQVTALSACVVLGLDQMARTLLQNKCDVNARNPVGGETALHLAVAAGDGEMTALLLTYNANVGSRTAGGQTALHVAAANPQGQICADLLLRYDADVNAVGVNKKTPLHAACSQNHVDLCVMLLEHGANVCTKAHYPPHGWCTAQEFGQQEPTAVAAAASSASDDTHDMPDASSGKPEPQEELPQNLDTDCTSGSGGGMKAPLCNLLQLVTARVQGAQEASLAAKGPVPAVFAPRLLAAALVPVSAPCLSFACPLPTPETVKEDIAWLTVKAMREIKADGAYQQALHARE